MKSSLTLSVEIAGVRLTLIGTEEDLFDHFRQTYRGFVCRDEADGYRIAVETRPGKSSHIADLPTLEQRGSTARFVDRDGSELVLDRNTKMGRMICFRWKVPGLEEPQFLGPGTHLRLLVATELAYSGGILLHASAVEINGHGVLFVGPSGAGKTTISTLFPPSDVLNDELVALFPSSSRPTVMATPFSGESRIPRTRRVCPIGMIFLIHHAKTTSIGHIDRPSAFSSLMRCVLVPCGQDDLEHKLFATAHHLVDTARIHLLGFAKDPIEVQNVVGHALQNMP